MKKPVIKLIIITVVILAVLSAMIIPALGSTTGDITTKVAVGGCKTYMMRLVEDQESNPNPFKLKDLKEDTQDYIENEQFIYRRSNARKVGYWIKKDDLKMYRGKDIIIVSKAFQKTPDSLFNKEPWFHAVGYSDTSSEIITVNQFKQIDLSRFIETKLIKKHD